jgi:hypothetical protein
MKTMRRKIWLGPTVLQMNPPIIGAAILDSPLKRFSIPYHLPNREEGTSSGGIACMHDSAEFYPYMLRLIIPTPEGMPSGRVKLHACKKRL